MRGINQSEKKERAIAQMLADTNWKVGDSVTFNERKVISDYKPSGNREKFGVIAKIDPSVGIVIVRSDVHNYKLLVEDIKRSVRSAGASPFLPETRIKGRSKSLESIIFEFELMEKRRNNDFYEQGVRVNEINWDPIVFMPNNEKAHYQRPFVWSVEDKQLLIESIYTGIDCGKIVVRTRSFSEITALVNKGETTVAFHDIVDGKQRLNAISEFVNNKFPDMHGNYFNDLSDESIHRFGDFMGFQFAALPENTPDKKVLEQFLMVNFAGVPQSAEHINFVKGLIKTF